MLVSPLAPYSDYERGREGEWSPWEDILQGGIILGIGLTLTKCEYNHVVERVLLCRFDFCQYFRASFIKRDNIH